ncbi:MAG: CRTAC1 family protein [Pirellulales bacterium]
MTRSAPRLALMAALLLALLGALVGVLISAGSGGGPAGGPASEPLNEGRDTRPPGFRDVASERGLDFKMQFLPNEQGENFKINLYDHGCGVVVGDYNGDGHDDILFLNQLGSNALCRNRGDGTFEDATDEAGVGLADRICVGGTFADYDNDGDQDLYITTTRGGNVLFQNRGDGRFQDVTKEAGLTLVAHSQTAAFFDADNDGYLDLLVTNSAGWTTETFDEEWRYYAGLAGLAELLTAPKEFNTFYGNQRDGTFADETEAAGLRGQGWGGDVAVFDYDDDGDLDAFITNMFGRSQLYANDGASRFRDVTAETLKRTSFGAIGSMAFDFNNDGRFDLFQVDMHSDMWMNPNDLEHVRPRHKYAYFTGGRSERNEEKALELEHRFAAALGIEYDRVIFGNTLHKNLGGGRFEEISDGANLETFWPWGVATGDFDNDGLVDIFLPSGMGYPYWYHPNALLMNNGDESFTDRAAAEGIEPPRHGMFLPEPIGGEQATRSSRAAATADFDSDGRLDLIVNNFNDHPYYFKNQFPRQNYLAFRLVGRRSNRDAIGAVAKLRLGHQVLVRQVPSAGGYLSQSSKTLYFGLGSSKQVDQVEIRWPSGVRQTLRAPGINRLHELLEPATDETIETTP